MNCEPSAPHHAAAVLGRTGDFFRFWWASFYWNARKGWFRLLGAHRDDCPCQNPSDSGLAGDTRCNAIIHWHRPERFRRVCPLLVQTPEGLRCSVEAEGVRPFWGRAVLAMIGLLATLYLGSTATVYLTLHVSGYQLGYRSIVWPGSWSDIRQAQEKLYAGRAKTAIESGDLSLAISSLETVCRINPKNYHAGLALARLSQLAGQANISEHVYERLMVDVPEERVHTARTWFRSLLARGAYAKIIPLAAMMLGEDPEQRPEWLHALLFAARQSRDAQALVQVLHQNPLFPEWCTELIMIESSALQDRLSSVLPRLTEPQRPLKNAYIARYQINALLEKNELSAAQSLLAAYEDNLPADTLHLLRLQFHQRQGSTPQAVAEFARALKPGMSAHTAERLAATLVAQPSAENVRNYYSNLIKASLPLSNETLPLYHAAFIVAKISGEKPTAELVRAQLRAFNSAPDRNLEALGQLLVETRSSSKLEQLLPLVPLPTEVVYALVEKHQDLRAP